jgi:hypothetical protein
MRLKSQPTIWHGECSKTHLKVEEMPPDVVKRIFWKDKWLVPCSNMSTAKFGIQNPWRNL